MMNNIIYKYINDDNDKINFIKLLLSFIYSFFFIYVKYPKKDLGSSLILPF